MLVLILITYVALMAYCGYRANIADVYESAVATLLNMISKDLARLEVRLVALGGAATASGKAIFEFGLALQDREELL